jgi:hypothetical protein
MTYLEPIDGGRNPVSHVGLGEIIPAGADSQWHRLPTGSFGVFINGRWRSTDGLRFTWGRVTRRGVKPGGSTIIARPNRDPGSARSTWRLVPGPGADHRPRKVDAVSIEVVGRDRADSPSAISPPIAFQRTPLSAVVGTPGARALVQPFVLHGMPCVNLPTLSGGVGDLPQVVVDWRSDLRVMGVTSPFIGASDVNQLVRLPMERSPLREKRLHVYWVAGVPGEARAPSVRVSG